MNCLNARSRRQELVSVEPTAPPYYPPQPPFNPDYFYDVPYESCDFGSTYDKAFYETEGYGEDTYEGNDSEYYECDGWGRRSLYEGVNWMPVSALTRVRRAARCRTALTHYYTCCVCI